MLHLHQRDPGRKTTTWRSRAIRAAIGAAVPCLILAGRSWAIPEEPVISDVEYDWAGSPANLYFWLYWDGSSYSSTDKMHIYRDLGGGDLQEFSGGTTWASFGDADIRDDNWQSAGEYKFVLQADDGTDLSWPSEDYTEEVPSPWPARSTVTRCRAVCVTARHQSAADA